MPARPTRRAFIPVCALIAAWCAAPLSPAMAEGTVVNSPPAAATLLFLGRAARVDRAADSARAVRLTLEGAAPAVASLPPFLSANASSSSSSPAPLIQRAAPALAAVPPGAPLTLILTTADGAQRSLVARTTASPPQWLEEEEGGGPASLAVDAELVGGPADVGLGRGAAAVYVSAPGGLTPANLPARLESGAGTGAALMIDVRIV
jgi:hypothetical protein